MLDQCRADSGGAAEQAYHRSGYVWAFDRQHDRERCFRWRARPNDSYEHGLPVDEQERRKMLVHEIEAAAAPDTGWRHFRFCECRSCSPAEHMSKRQKRLRLLLGAPLVCVLLLGLLFLRPSAPEPLPLVGLVMVLSSGAIFALWQRGERRKWRRERQMRRQGPRSAVAPDHSETAGPVGTPAPPETRPSAPPATAAARAVGPSARPDVLPAQPAAPADVDPPMSAPEPPEAPLPPMP